MRRNLKLIIVLTVLAFGSFVIFRGRATEAQSQTVTAGQKFKNIKVLNDMPADQLGRVMNMFSASLGVDCDFCHVQGDFSKDDKRPKNTAREMIKMTLGINKDHFKGRPEISCNTCHNGHEHPQSQPNLTPVAQEEPPKQPATKPDVDQILATYLTALGGKARLEKITSRTETATRTERDNKTVEHETLYYEPGKYSLKTVYPQATVTEFYDGSAAAKYTRQPISLRADEQENIRREADMFSPANLKTVYPKMEFRTVDRINGRDVYIILATTANNTRERLYFDVANGLLVRRVSSSQTIFGAFAYQVDYSDYRIFGGVKVPTLIRYSMPNITWTRRILSVKNNVPVDERVFKAPIVQAGS